MKNKSFPKKAFWICLALFAYSCAVMLVSFKITAFSEWYSRNISAFLRRVLSGLTGVFPFSIAEILVIAVLPILVIVTLVSLVGLVFLKKKACSKILGIVPCAVLCAASLFANVFGVCYNRLSAEQNFGLSEKKTISKDELYNVSDKLRSELEITSESVEFNTDGASVCPYSWKELNRKIDKGYDNLRKEYGFVSNIKAPAKRILLSPIMTYAHISGIYMPLTGEANVNTNYPDYVVCYTTAHEKAHQRGISGEDEANFIAYLACAASEDDYLVYCAQMSMYDYFLSAVYDTDSGMYSSLLSESPKKVLSEMDSYYRFFEKYRNSAASDVAYEVNDAYLKTLGQDEGVKSYDLVIRLMTEWYEKHGNVGFN